jgi:hypothetical protein
MFGKHNTLTRLSSGIAIAASLAVIAVPSALATTSSRSFITDTLGGNGSPKAAPDAIGRYVGSHATPQGKAFAWDTLGANGQPVRPTGSYPNYYVNAGMSAAVAQSNQAPATRTQFNHRESTQAQPSREAAVSSVGGTGFNWGDAGIGAGLAAGLLLLLLLAGTRLRTNRRGAVIA